MQLKNYYDLHYLRELANNPTDWNILIKRINNVKPPIKTVSKKKTKRIGKIKRKCKAVLVSTNNEQGPPKIRKLTLTLVATSIIIRNPKKRTIEEAEASSNKRIRTQEK